MENKKIYLNGIKEFKIKLVTKVKMDDLRKFIGQIYNRRVPSHISMNNDCIYFDGINEFYIKKEHLIDTKLEDYINKGSEYFDLYTILTDLCNRDILKEGLYEII